MKQFDALAALLLVALLLTTGELHAQQDCRPRECRAIAQNPETPADVLTHLAKHEDRRVRAAVAKHPNTPPQIAARLNEELGEKKKKRRGLLRKVVGVAAAVGGVDALDLPPEAAEMVVGAILDDSKAKAEQAQARVEQFLETNYETHYLGHHGAMIDPIIAAFTGLMHPQAPPPPFASNVTPEELDRLAGDPDFRVRAYVAMHPRTPPEILERLSQEKRKKFNMKAFSILYGWANGPVVFSVHGVRDGVTINPSTPTHVLERLHREEAVVASNLARNPSTPPYILEELANRRGRAMDSYVRQAVGFNPSTPLHVLEKLASDEKSRVRLGIPLNPNATTEMLTQLASDPDSDVRRAVREAAADRPDATPEILAAADAARRAQRSRIFGAIARVAEGASQLDLPVDTKMAVAAGGVAAAAAAGDDATAGRIVDAVSRTGAGGPSIASEGSAFDLGGDEEGSSSLDEAKSILASQCGPYQGDDSNPQLDTFCQYAYALQCALKQSVEVGEAGDVGAERRRRHREVCERHAALRQVSGGAACPHC